MNLLKANAFSETRWRGDNSEPWPEIYVGSRTNYDFRERFYHPFTWICHTLWIRNGNVVSFVAVQYGAPVALLLARARTF
jgi:hypothetical protein